MCGRSQHGGPSSNATKFFGAHPPTHIYLKIENPLPSESADRLRLQNVYPEVPGEDFLKFFSGLTGNMRRQGEKRRV